MIYTFSDGIESQKKPVFLAHVIVQSYLLQASCLLQMENVASQNVKKKRVLPQWMLEPEKFSTVSKQKGEKPKDERPVLHVGINESGLESV